MEHCSIGFGKKFGFQIIDETYLKFLDHARDCLNRSLDCNIECSSIARAKFAIRSLIGQARSELRLFTSRSRLDILADEEIIEGILACFDRGNVGLSLVCHGPTEEKLLRHSLVSQILSIKARVNIAVTNNRSIGKCNTNFLVTDSSAYWIVK